MIELDITDKQKSLEQHFHSIPEQWFYYATQCILEIETLLGIYGMSLDDVDIAEVKEKYGEFRMDCYLKLDMDAEYTDSEYNKRGCIDDIIIALIGKWKREIRSDTESGKLPKFY